MHFVRAVVGVAADRVVDDVGAAPVGELLHRVDEVVLAVVDREVGAELAARPGPSRARRRSRSRARPRRGRAGSPRCRRRPRPRARAASRPPGGARGGAARGGRSGTRRAAPPRPRTASTPGSGTRRRRVAVVDSANPPPPKVGMASTRSPTEHAVDAVAEPSTTPATSAPGVNGSGGFTWYSPRHMSTSGKFSDAACTRSRTSPGRSSGSGRSSSTMTCSGSPSSWTLNAFTRHAPFGTMRESRRVRA